MSNEIEITTKFCHPYMNFGGEGGAQEFQYYPEIFAASFSITLGFWLIAKFGGLILETIKKA